MASAFFSSAQVVYEADFNGSGTGNGGTGNISTMGGTATLNSSGLATASIATGSPLFPGDTGGHLQTYETGAGVANINIAPSSAANCPDDWFILQGATGGSSSFDTVNGALDFYFTSSIPSSSWTTGTLDFRPLSINGGNSGLRLDINETNANALAVTFTAKNSAGTIVFTASAPNTSVTVAANKVYHIAVTLSTDPSSGVITLRWYLAPGNTPINTTSTSAAYLMAKGTTGPILGTGTNAVTHAFNDYAGYWFGQGYGNDTITKTICFDCFRVYGSVPAVFNSVQYLPDLAVTKPNPDPGPPTGSDLFSPPVVVGGAPAANTPTIAEWTRTGGAGDALAVTGYHLSTSLTAPDLGKDSSFACFGENSGSLGFTSGDIDQLSTAGANGSYTASAAVRLGELPTAANSLYGSMYLLWPSNANGYGAPVAVNKTEAWWVGPDQAAANTPVTLYGRNLSHNGGTTTSYLYFKLQGSSSGSWLTPTSVNPYAVTFTVPSGTANGTYEIWAHNGHGGDYGWSGPVLLSVVSPITWSGPTIDVTNFTYGGTHYSADKTGATDSTLAISKAIVDAGTTAYSTVSFPAGTYLISGPLGPVPANVQLLGANQTTTTIEAATQANGADYHMFEISSANVYISNLTLDGHTVVSTAPHPDFYLLHGGGTGLVNFHVTHCTLLARSYPIGTSTSSQNMVYMPGGNHKFFEGCIFQGTTFDLGGSGEYQVFIDSCTFAGMYDTVLCNEGAASEFAFTNNIGEDYDYLMGYAFTNTPITGSDPNTTGGGYYDPTKDPNATGWSIGLLVKGLNGGGARKNIYFAGNHTYNLGVRIGNNGGSNNDWGEQIAFEENYGYFLGAPSSATSTTATFSSLTSLLNASTPMQAMIINGTGLGQVRDVQSPIATTAPSTITLANGETWAVTPDTTSNIALGWYVNQVAVYGNFEDGKPRNRDGAKGIMPYGGVENVVGDSNTMTRMEEGIHIYSQGQRDQGNDPTPWWHVNPVYWGFYTRNTITDAEFAMYQDGDDASDALPELYGLGNVYTHNTIGRDANAYDSGVAAMYILTKSGPANQPIVDTQIYDQNVSTNGPQGFLFNPESLSGLTGATLISNNDFSVPSGTSGSYGVSFRSGVPAEVSNNSYSGFALNYTGSPPGAVLADPTRVFNEDATSGGTAAQDLVPIFNDGTSSETWTVTSDSTWLTTSPATGTVAIEGAGSTWIICSPSGLSTGLHTGTLTFGNGTQTQKVLVNFTVH